MNIGESIKENRERRGLSQRELAKLAGLSGSFISRLEAGLYRLTSPDTVNSLAKALKIHPEELYRAAGIIKDSKAVYEIPQKTPDELVAELQVSMPVMIPIHGSIPAGSPDTREEETGDYIAITREELGSTRKNLQAFKVNGNSLEGDNIHNSDFIIVDPDTSIIDNKIYVIRLGNELVARHVKRLNDKLRLSSSNKHYQDIEVDEAIIIGRVIRAGGNWLQF